MPQRVRVLLVDDDPDIRFLLRATLARDEHFDVVAEAANGAEALDAVTATDVDLVVLDREMPVMDGLTALPLLHERAPGAAVVLYTARNDDVTRQAAVASGAAGVVGKEAIGPVFVERIARTLVSHWGGEDSVEIRVGPVPSPAALAWITNTRRILDAVEARPDVVGEALPTDAMARFRELLELWEQLASAEPTFFWTARADPPDVDRLVRAWAAVDSIPDERLAALGCSWSGPAARPFFEALTGGVLDAMSRHAETRQLAATLAAQWS